MRGQVMMVRGHGSDPDRPAWEVAPDVYCVGPWGRTQTNVYLVNGGSWWVLIDAGWAGDGPRIDRAARFLLGTAQPVAILLTHCHPDHSGAAPWLARTWGCGVYLHPEELPIAAGDFAAMQETANPLDRWAILPMMRAMGSRRRGAMLARASLGEVAETLTPGSEIPVLPGWECLATPGHTPGHVAYYRPGDGTLISGDALLTVKVNTLSGLLSPRPGLSGPPWYTTWSRQTAGASLRALAHLGPAVVAGGHGIPMRGTGMSTALRDLGSEA